MGKAKPDETPGLVQVQVWKKVGSNPDSTRMMFGQWLENTKKKLKVSLACNDWIYWRIKLDNQ